MGRFLLVVEIVSVELIEIECRDIAIRMVGVVRAIRVQRSPTRSFSANISVD